MTDHATRVEMLLLARADWVSVTDISQACSIDERLLRADGRRRPLCSRFAISSSTKGIKHIRFATVKERIKYKHARLRTLIAYRRALDDYNTALHNCLTGKKPEIIERHTGQMVFL